MQQLVFRGGSRERVSVARAFCFCFQLLALLHISISAQAPASETAAALPLNFRERIERQIAGGQKQSYTISLPADSYALVKIEQLGIDISARLSGPDGKLIFEFDSEIRPRGSENVEVVSSSTGVFKLEVEAKFKDAAADKYALLLEEVRPASDRDRSLDTVRRLETESRSLDRAGDRRKALANIEKAIEIAEPIIGANDPSIGRLTNRLGTLHFALGDNQRSEIFLRKALAIHESQPVREDLSYADSLNNLAVVLRIKGDFVEAERLWLQVISIRERELGPDHPAIVTPLNNLGILYRKRGDYSRAEASLLRGLSIREKALGPNHLDTATLLMNLGALSYFKGDYDAALALDLRALAISESNRGPDHNDVVLLRVNVATAYGEIGEFEKARHGFDRAIRSYAGSSSPNLVGLSAAEYGLANLLKERGELTAAKPYYRSAIEKAEKNFAADPLRLASYLSGQAETFVLEGKYSEAEIVLERVLEISESVMGPNHPDVGKACDALARLYNLNNDIENALRFQSRANAINETHIARNLTTGSEHQRLAFMASMSSGMAQTLDLHALKAKTNTLARDLAFTAVLQRKGRVLDSVSLGLSALNRRLDPESQLLLQRASDAGARLAELALAGPQKGNFEAFQKQLAAVSDEKDRLDKEISRRSAGYYEIPKTVALPSVAAALPGDTALIEFAVFRPLPRTKSDKDNSTETARYVVYVLNNAGEVKWADLGAVRQIDEAVFRFRAALRDPKRRDVHVLARELDQKIMRPLRSLIGNAQRILISPDGELSLVPFEALVDENNKFLVERFAVTYLSSGRDLVRTRSQRKDIGAPLIVADPDFGGTSDPSTTVVSGKNVVEIGSSETGSRTQALTRNLRDKFFAQLAGTGAEARAIRSLFPESKVLLGDKATETAIKQAAAPKMLHVATHGFFLQNTTGWDSPSETVRRSPGASTKAVENPLLRSGLAFAGANRRGGNTDDGILTALETSGLDLWGTKLVVLSACDTGVGVVHTGEGVYGLRRSFQIAGAESLVMSLWPISDYVTRQLMTGYYTNLKAGFGRGESLRRVQLEMLKRPNWRHPFYWASFIQSGEWANLDGKR